MKIITRKKGNQKDFYLRHSIRQGPKIINEEIYLGKKIPKNIELIKQKLKANAKKEMYKKLEKIKNHFQEEWKRYPESMKKKEMEEIAISFTYNTNAIEGSTITLEEVREITQENLSPNKSIRDVKETEAHYKTFLRMINKKEKISNKLLLRWHKEIFNETKEDISGKFRDYFVRVGNYIAPDWQDLPKLMREFINFTNETILNPVELAARIHYRFEKIHPFGDGNGRIGRLLMNWVLWYNGYPMLIIEYKKRKSYYRALQKIEDDFVSYFLRRYFFINKNRLKQIINKK